MVVHVSYCLQIIITCRTEYLEAKGSYRSLFTPSEASRDTSKLQELFVRSFGGNQVSQYFTQWVKQREGGADSGGSQWTAQRYVDMIEHTPGLKELAQTPFVLRAMADALPRLEKLTESDSGGAEAKAQRKITRADVYTAFIDQCWEVETKRLQRNWPPGLPVDYDAPLSFTNYSTDLAVDMLARNQVRRRAVHRRGGVCVCMCVCAGSAGVCRCGMCACAGVWSVRVCGLCGLCTCVSVRERVCVRP